MSWTPKGRQRVWGVLAWNTKTALIWGLLDEKAEGSYLRRPTRIWLTRVQATFL